MVFFVINLFDNCYRDWKSNSFRFTTTTTTYGKILSMVLV